MCRLMTTQLAEALEGYPLYSQDGKGKEAVCRAVFALGSVRWFILEGNREDDDVILFGIVVGLMEDEYGYISLNELSDVELDLSAQGLGKLQVRQQQNFKPVPLKQIQDSRLQEFHGKWKIVVIFLISLPDMGGAFLWKTRMESGISISDGILRAVYRSALPLKPVTVQPAA